jgi:hypothetical protein
MMGSEKKRKIAKVLSLIVIVAGIIVIIGWIFNIGILKSISPEWVSMKLATAVAFVLSGVTLYFIAKAREGEFDIAHVVLSITSLLIVLIMGILFFSALLKINTGAEDLFIKEQAGAVKTVVPGQPSVPTMLNFLFIAAAGVLTMLNPKELRSKLRIIGLIVGIIGTVPVVGYIISVPLLYYFIDGINSAIAFNTAVLFVLLGKGLVCLSD